MSEKLPSLLAACAVTFMIFAAAAPAMAQSRAIVVTAPEAIDPVRRVSYRDLNLASLGDEKILLKRVGTAVRDVCAEAMPSQYDFVSFTMTCRGNSWRDARPQIKRAVQRAREVAANGYSSIAPVAISISVR